MALKTQRDCVSRAILALQCTDDVLLQQFEIRLTGTNFLVSVAMYFIIIIIIIIIIAISFLCLNPINRMYCNSVL